MAATPEEAGLEMTRRVDLLNTNMGNWMALFNSIREGKDFPLFSRFLWKEKMDVLYGEVPEGYQLKVEVAASVADGLRRVIPMNVSEAKVGDIYKSYVLVDSPSSQDPNRIVLKFGEKDQLAIQKGNQRLGGLFSPMAVFSMSVVAK